MSAARQAEEERGQDSANGFYASITNQGASDVSRCHQWRGIRLTIADKSNPGLIAVVDIRTSSLSAWWPRGTKCSKGSRLARRPFRNRTLCNLISRFVPAPRFIAKPACTRSQWLGVRLSLLCPRGEPRLCLLLAVFPHILRVLDAHLEWT